MAEALSCPQVGSGTDPTEGAALAAAVLNTLAGRSRLTMASTHHAELNNLAVSTCMQHDIDVAHALKSSCHMTVLLLLEPGIFYRQGMQKSLLSQIAAGSGASQLMQLA